MKDHINVIAALASLVVIVGAGIVLLIHGMNDETVLAILFTGAVTIAQTIAGVQKPSQSSTETTVVAPPAPPVTTRTTSTTTGNGA